MHLIGSHCIEYFGGLDEEADTEDEDEEMEVGEVKCFFLFFLVFVFITVFSCNGRHMRTF